MSLTFSNTGGGDSLQGGMGKRGKRALPSDQRRRSRKARAGAIPPTEHGPSYPGDAVARGLMGDPVTTPRGAGVAALWKRRGMQPEHSEELVEDVLAGLAEHGFRLIRTEPGTLPRGIRDACGECQSSAREDCFLRGQCRYYNLPALEAADA